VEKRDPLCPAFYRNEVLQVGRWELKDIEHSAISKNVFEKLIIMLRYIKRVLPEAISRYGSLRRRISAGIEN